ncbi:MAG: hypothetical protein MZV64_63345 [Ignavibacteriales bacterium]|nr:hypothetical protein [Ignavibacteriales bacterium]
MGDVTMMLMVGAFLGPAADALRPHPGLVRRGGLVGGLPHRPAGQGLPVRPAVRDVPRPGRLRGPCSGERGSSGLVPEPAAPLGRRRAPRGPGPCPPGSRRPPSSPP